MSLTVFIPLLATGCGHPEDPSALDQPPLPAVSTAPVLHAVGPRMVSNQTDYPLWVYGERLREGLALLVAGEKLPLHVLDDRTATTLLPQGASLGGRRIGSELSVLLVDELGATQEGVAPLTVVDDIGFPVFTSMVHAPRGGRLFVASPNEDKVFGIELKTGEVTPRAAGDGPVGLALYTAGKVEEILAVHAFQRGLSLLTVGRPTEAWGRTTWQASAVTVHRGRAFVSDIEDHCVHVLDLEPFATERRCLKVGPNPGALVVAGSKLVVANRGSGDLSIVDLETTAEVRAVPTPTTSIVGGPTEALQPWVMGGKAVRALAWSPRLQRVFAASVGPNIGPNPARSEVSMNGGIGVVDVGSATWLRHVSMGVGVPSALALDDTRGLLYVASVSTGEVMAFDAEALAKSDEAARGARLAVLALVVPSDTPRIRPPAEWDLPQNAGWTSPSLHAGPSALALSTDGNTLWVLERFTGSVVELDVSEARGGKLVETREVARLPRGDAPLRALGEVLYHTDLGRTQMTCDTCHLEGHSEGVLFTKNEPMRIYRSPSLRGVRDTAPYFTPARFPSMEQAMEIVLGRNRYHRPNPTKAEVGALSAYVDAIVPLPNPYFDEVGRLPETIQLPFHGSAGPSTGRPAEGARLFRERRCVECHPPPQFSTDQDPNTRGRLYDVGTPEAIPIRPEQQDLEPISRPPASLLGLWDAYPLLFSGSAGFYTDGVGRLIPSDDVFALSGVLEHSGNARHGEMAGLTASERNDVLAYLLTL